MSVARFHQRVCSLLLVVALAACIALPLAAQTPADEQGSAKSLGEHQRWVTSLAFAPESDLLVTVGGQSLHYRAGDVKLWKLSDGSLSAELKGHESSVWSASISPDGKTLVTGGYDGTIVVWDLASKKARKTLKQKGWCRCVQVAPDNKHFVAAMEDGSLVVSTLAGDKEAATIKAHEAAVYDLAFSPDGKTLATASIDKTAKLWDFSGSTAKEKSKLEGHTDAVWSIIFSPQGDQVATASADRTIRIWKADGKALTTIRGHKNWITNISFSPDGQTLASCCMDGSVKLWNLQLAVKLAGELEEVAQKLQTNRAALDKANDDKASSEATIKASSDKAEALLAVAAAAKANLQNKEAAEAAKKYPKNEYLQKAAAQAKKDAADPAKQADEKIKAFASDKEFSAQLKKLLAGAPADAQKEAEKSQQALAKAKTASAKADTTIAQAEQAIDEARELSGKFSDLLATVVSEGNKSCWVVKFSPDGKLLASGHKDTVKVWNLPDRQERFPAKKDADEEGEEEEAAAAEEVE